MTTTRLANTGCTVLSNDSLRTPVASGMYPPPP